MPGKKVYAVFGSTEAEPIAEIPFSEMSDEDLNNMAEGQGLLTGPCVSDISCKIIKVRIFQCLRFRRSWVCLMKLF